MSWELRLGDCLGPDGLATLADKSVDHVICDPPYEAEAHTKQRRVKRGSVMSVEPLSFAPMSAASRAAVATHFGRLARRWVLVFCQIEASHLWAQALEEAGLAYKRTCIWVKRDGMPQYTGDRPGMGYETLVACHAQGKSRWNGGGKHGVFNFPDIPDVFDVLKNDAERTGHPTQKPLALMERLIRDFTNPGELILDPYAGSGTTGVAAVHCGRRFIGWEVDRAYWEKARRRISTTREQLDLLGLCKANA